MSLITDIGKMSGPKSKNIVYDTTTLFNVIGRAGLLNTGYSYRLPIRLV